MKRTPVRLKWTALLWLGVSALGHHPRAQADDATKPFDRYLVESEEAQASGDLAGAERSATAALEAATKPYERAAARYRLARLHEVQGRAHDAASAYRSFLTDAEGVDGRDIASARTQARASLARLETKAASPSPAALNVSEVVVSGGGHAVSGVGNHIETHLVDQRQQGFSTYDIVVFTSYLAAGMGLAIGATLGALVLDRTSALHAQCAQLRCPARLRGLYGEATDFAAGADAAFVGAGVLAGIGTLALIIQALTHRDGAAESAKRFGIWTF